MIRRGARVAVVGGGVGGLTTAYRLLSDEAPIEVVVFETDERAGGKLRSVNVGGLTLPAGADSFVARKPWAVELCRELGLGGELVAPAARAAYLWTDHGLEAFPRDAPFGIPGDIGDVLRWPGLSRAGRTRAAKDLVMRARKRERDESLGSLLRRRLGDEATERAVAPLLEGLFAGDADRLSVRATFPELVEWERSQGSLIRGSQGATRNAHRADAGPMFVKPRGGVDRLTDALARSLGARLRTRTSVANVGVSDDGYSLVLDGPGRLGEGATAGQPPFDAVVIASPAFIASDLLRGLAPQAATDLASIPYASTGVVLMVYPEGSQAGLPDGSGFVVPRGRAPMTASTWLSSKWPDEDFGSRAVVRCYVGGVGAEDILDADDADLIEACARHLTAVVPLPPRPEHAAVVRWPRAMPQYEVGHADRLARIRASLPAGIVVTGQAYDGVGVPDCVRAAGEAAAAVTAHLVAKRWAKETVR
ncbi:MAG: protoporphyrinogen oxidase [Actinomycetota bacterium]|nr:protoporphyrinogen oxidase [Actinomycetota bacterium]